MGKNDSTSDVVDPSARADSNQNNSTMSSISKGLNKQLIGNDNEVLGSALKKIATQFFQEAMDPTRERSSNLRNENASDTLLHNDLGRSISRTANKMFGSGEDATLGTSVKNMAFKFAQDALNQNNSNSPNSAPTPEPKTNLVHNSVMKALSKTANYVLTGESNKTLGETIRGYALQDTQHFLRDVNGVNDQNANDNEKKMGGILGALKNNSLAEGISKAVNKYLVSGEDKVLGATLRDSAVKLAQDAMDPSKAASKTNSPETRPTTLLNNDIGKMLSRSINERLLGGEKGELLGDRMRNKAVKELGNIVQDVRAGASEKSGSSGIRPESPMDRLSNAIDRAAPHLETTHTPAPEPQVSNSNKITPKLG